MSDWTKLYHVFPFLFNILLLIRNKAHQNKGRRNLSILESLSLVRLAKLIYDTQLQYLLKNLS
jgi:hypothetical protein